ncbi:hypothetical protein VTN31DRAFT_7114 [Thermomyces dupontii]|uniref:uncharacterized protein n=1 Tax=Talaromyces thermophilus TaxID=28565 RepID=UPI00374282A8
MDRTPNTKPKTKVLFTSSYPALITTMVLSPGTHPSQENLTTHTHIYLPYRPALNREGPKQMEGSKLNQPSHTLIPQCPCHYTKVNVNIQCRTYRMQQTDKINLSTAHNISPSLAKTSWRQGTTVQLVGEKEERRDLNHPVLSARAENATVYSNKQGNCPFVVVIVVVVPRRSRKSVC